MALDLFIGSALTLLTPLMTARGRMKYYQQHKKIKGNDHLNQWDTLVIAKRGAQCQSETTPYYFLLRYNDWGGSWLLWKKTKCCVHHEEHKREDPGNYKAIKP